ncbi:hypothetical protein [Sinanaerobacter sp. ZZT-01]|uniref:hypothetical protein n=1 Tax=Sinanaerobacter sp. ZZT-01 TaxID=3111540 RepID=UPI002D795B85|nr:hypothetical protein [Sinanaerobacter sp. ZZT-01]WRR94233.1 hypothetical protein U5921_03690 [Sinanaerobacter sp. ZZT-01]
MYHIDCFDEKTYYREDNKIIQVIFGVGWGYLFYSIADSFIEWSKTDKVWNTFFIILFCLIGILLHFVSHTEMIGDDHEDNTAKYAYKNQSSYKETVGNYYTGNSYRTENSNEKSDTSDYQSTSNSQSKSQFNPFAGCTTKEELKIRYKQLIKSFHPDLEMGDEEAAKFLNNEYERLMEEFEM